MKSIVINNFKYNKKTTLALIISISVSFVLIFLTSFIFSSIHNYMIKEVTKETGNYHVKIKTNLIGFEDFSSLKKIKWQGNYVLITYNNIKDVYKLTNKMCKKTKCEDISYNDSYLSLYGISKNKNLLKTFQNIIIIILLIILVSAYFIIYNVYKIFLFQRYKQIGILKSIGMTKKQLTKMLVIEGLIISTISIIISFALSLLIMAVLIVVINNLLKGLITFSFNIHFLIYSIVFIMLLVIIISLMPILKINKSSIALFNSAYKLKKINHKFNNITCLLAYTNYKRSKNHYKPVIISLFICIVLYSTFNIILNYGLKIIDKYVLIPKYDVEITVKENSEKAYKLLNDFGSKYASKYKIYTYCQSEIIIEKDNYLTNGPQKVNLYLIEGNNYFVNKSVDVITEDGKMIRKETKRYKNSIDLNVNNRKIVLKESDNIPFGFENLLTKDNLIVSTKSINNLCETNLTLFMKSSKKLDSKLEKLLDSDLDLYYVDMKKGKMMISNIILAVKIILYSILILTLTIGIASVISASFLSMEYRKKEFGILKSLGFTKEKFNEMIILESLFIVLKAFLIALPLVILINVLINNIINNIVDVKLTISYKPLIFCLLVSIIIVRTVMHFCYKKHEKTSILNLIYKENI